MTRTSDDILDELALLRFRDGDVDALEPVVRRWYPRFLRHAWQLTQQSEAAADNVQEAWIAIVRGVNKLDDPAAFPAWAYRIVTNKAVDWVRRRQRERRLESDAEVAREDCSPIPQSTAAHSDDISSAIRMLPIDQRIVISMFYLEEHSVAEIAAVLEIPVGTVKSRLHAAREQLRLTLERSNNDQSR